VAESFNIIANSSLDNLLIIACMLCLHIHDVCNTRGCPSVGLHLFPSL
jgi:hypothetical protein